MVALSKITATVPVTDMTRSKDFYENKLGLKVSTMTTPPDGVLYEGSDGSYFYLYQRPAAPAEHTLASFMVSDLVAAVTDLSQKGVVFEHYDLPNLKTDAMGIFTMSNAKSAWFKDPDGHVFSLLQMS